MTQVFDNFLREEWDAATFEAFTHGLRRLDEPSPVPCIEYPSDHVPRRGDSPWVCLNKAIAIADHVLGQRSANTAHVFAAVLLSQVFLCYLFK